MGFVSSKRQTEDKKTKMFFRQLKLNKDYIAFVWLPSELVNKIVSVYFNQQHGGVKIWVMAIS